MTVCIQANWQNSPGQQLHSNRCTTLVNPFLTPEEHVEHVHMRAHGTRLSLDMHPHTAALDAAVTAADICCLLTSLLLLLLLPVLLLFTVTIPE